MTILSTVVWQVGWEILSSSNEYTSSESRLQSAIKALVDSEKQEKDTRQLIDTISDRLAVFKDTLSNVEQDLVKAQRRVQELESQKAAIQEDMASTSRQVDDAQGKLATLASEIRKRVQAISVSGSHLPVDSFSTFL